MDNTTPPARKILLVDDDAAWRQLYGLELTSKGYVVVNAEDGEDGLEKAKSEKPNLIVLDIMMPKMDGITMLTKIKDDTTLKSIPVIMLTNFGQEELVKQAFNVGLSDYVLKYQVTPAELVERIEKTLSTTQVLT